MDNENQPESEVPPGRETQADNDEYGTTPQKKGDTTIYIGKKGVMGYVLAVVTQFNNGATDVAIKARGKLISRAVDVAEIVRNRFMPSAVVKDIQIKTEQLQSEDGSQTNVSAIEIFLHK
jgi:DNA-binding protein